MKNKIQNFVQVSQIIITIVVSLALSACGIITINPGGDTQPTDAVVETLVVPPTATTPPAEPGSVNFSLETYGVLSGYTAEIVSAVAQDGGAPYWEVLPAYTRITPQGYGITNHLMRPQIVVYPVADLVAINPSAAQVVASLQTLLQSPQEVTVLPYLPMVNMNQTFHSNLQYIEFKNGSGLRYLTEFGQGIVPVNNFELLYTFQGLTHDGKYYIAANFPVNHPSLPADSAITGNEPLEFSNDFNAYIQNVAQSLNIQASNSFIPDLTLLDAMMSSVEAR